MESQNVYELQASLRNGGAEHSGANLPSVRGLVTAAVARNDCHLTLAGDLVSGYTRDGRAQNGEALQHFFDNILRAVNERFHELLV